MPDKYYSKMWGELRRYILNYKNKHTIVSTYGHPSDRYDVSISCDDLIKIMDHIEEAN